MASYSSGFQSYALYSREELVDKLTSIIYADKDGGYNEASHDFQILRNGVLVYDGIDSSSYNGYLEHWCKLTPEEYQTQEAYDAAEADNETIRLDLEAVMIEANLNANIKTKAAAEAAAEAKKQAEEKQRIKNKEAKELKDRETYNELRKKFEE